MKLNMQDYLIRRFPAEWSITRNTDGIVCIRDNGIARGKGYMVRITEEAMYYEACIEFEDYAVEIFNYADKQLTNPSHPVKKLLDTYSNLYCRRHMRYVEDIFNAASLRADGWWLQIGYRRSESYSTENFVDLLLMFLLQLFPYDAEAEEEGLAQAEVMIGYERSRVNRSLCLAFHGYGCKACGINLREQYGDVARQFIHVHHLNPLSSAGVRLVDPIADLIPLCPNCHGIAHLRNPPYTVAEIQNMIISNNGKLYA